MMRPVKWMGEDLKMPMDVIAGEPVITVTGRQNVYIENYHRILSFQEKEIRLRARTCQIVVEGKRLGIRYYTKEEILISGLITSVRMEGMG